MEYIYGFMHILLTVDLKFSFNSRILCYIVTKEVGTMSSLVCFNMWPLLFKCGFIEFAMSASFICQCIVLPVDRFKSRVYRW